MSSDTYNDEIKKTYMQMLLQHYCKIHTNILLLYQSKVQSLHYFYHANRSSAVYSHENCSDECKRRGKIYIAIHKTCRYVECKEMIVVYVPIAILATY